MPARRALNRNNWGALYESYSMDGVSKLKIAAIRNHGTSARD